MVVDACSLLYVLCLPASQPHLIEWCTNLVGHFRRALNLIYHAKVGLMYSSSSIWIPKMKSWIQCVDSFYDVYCTGLNLFFYFTLSVIKVALQICSLHQTSLYRVYDLANGL